MNIELDILPQSNNVLLVITLLSLLDIIIVILDTNTIHDIYA